MVLCWMLDWFPQDVLWHGVFPFWSGADIASAALSCVAALRAVSGTPTLSAEAAVPVHNHAAKATTQQLLKYLAAANLSWIVTFLRGANDTWNYLGSPPVLIHAGTRAVVSGSRVLHAALGGAWPNRGASRPSDVDVFVDLEAARSLEVCLRGHGFVGHESISNSSIPEYPGSVLAHYKFNHGSTVVDVVILAEGNYARGRVGTPSYMSSLPTVYRLFAAEPPMGSSVRSWVHIVRCGWWGQERCTRRSGRLICVPCRMRSTARPPSCGLSPQ